MNCSETINTTNNRSKNRQFATAPPSGDEGEIEMEAETNAQTEEKERENEKLKTKETERKTNNRNDGTHRQTLSLNSIIESPDICGGTLDIFHEHSSVIISRSNQIQIINYGHFHYHHVQKNESSNSDGVFRSS